ncbi:MAG: tetratricopeptide repeat protein [Terriglobia bacterium]|jgi:tetratricopeptide (TPR) repeat protein
MENKRPGRSRGGWLLPASAAVLICNAAYIAAFGAPTLFYVTNALLHPLLGLGVGILFVSFVTRHRRSFAGVWGSGGLWLLGLAAGFGFNLVFVGMTRPHSLALYAHVGMAVAGLFFLLIRFRGSMWASVGPEPEGLPSVWRWSLRVAVAAGVFYAVVAIYHFAHSDPRYRIENPSTPPLSMNHEGGGASSLLFPSSATTSDGKTITSQFFMDSESCRPCHTDIYNQWQSSMHHMASFNNQWYRKAIEYMQDTVGVKPSLWCGGCHDHALVFANKMQTHPIREVEDTREGQNGLGCMSCHSIARVKDTMGQGSFVMDYPPLDRLASSKNPLLHFIHDYAVKLDPKPHRNAFLKPFHKDPAQVPEFCSACHKVHLDVPVNSYRWIRGFNDYDNWQASGVSGQGARSFYYPPRPSQCADCHMPLVPSKDFGNINGLVHSHRFAAANTAIPTSYGDQEQVQQVESFLKGALSVDIFALAEESTGPAGPTRKIGGEAPQLASTFAVGEESSAGLSAAGVSAVPPVRLMAPLGRAAVQVRRGDTVRVEVVVRTRKLGHFFPGGTVDAFDCWLELQARDNQGRIVFWSGEAADNGHGPVEPGAHFYRSLQIDAHGNPINKRNAWSTRATMYAHLIPPGAADTVHFRMKIPEDCGDSITLTAKLNYRKFSWWNTQWAFAGVRDPAQPNPDVTKNYDDGRWVFQGDLRKVSAKFKAIPDVPTVEIARDTCTLPVLAKSTASFPESLSLDAADRERWNDYGIGLLLQGDLKGAERAFETVTKLDPGYADGWVNMARARVQEGNTDAAKPLLEKAIQLNSRLGSAHYFAGLAFKADGNYPAAFDEFSKASALYPRDRVVRNQMGRMLFLERKYQDAVAEFEKTLAVDPEDLEAHYDLMLCYRGLRDDTQAAREEKLYLRFKADESSRAITGPYKLAHPEDNNEAQPIHEHVSVALGQQGGRSAVGR